MYPDGIADVRKIQDGVERQANSSTERKLAQFVGIQDIFSPVCGIGPVCETGPVCGAGPGCEVNGVKYHQVIKKNFVDSIPIPNFKVNTFLVETR